MLGTGSEGDGVGAEVGGFDADHGAPAVGGHVGELGGELGPGVPDDSAFGVGFADGDAAFEDGVVDVDGSDGVEIGAVGFGGELEEGFALGFVFELVGFVEEAGVGEADEGDLLGVGDGEVGMEGFFELEGLVGGVGDDELEAEFGAEDDLVGELEAVVAEGAGGVVGREGEGEVEVVAGESGKGEGPLGEASEAVGGAIGAWVAGGGGAAAEPRKDNGDAAADGLVGSEGGAVGEEEDGVVAGGLPVGEVRAVEVELGGAGRGGDGGADEASFVLGEGEDIGDGEVVGEGLEIHANQCSAGIVWTGWIRV